MKDRKTELIKKLEKNRKQEEEIRNELTKIDYEERYNNSSSFLNKYYRYDKKFDRITVAYVYDIDKETCYLDGLSLSYYKDKGDSWYRIDYIHDFTPYERWDSDNENSWIEISKEEFMEHYNNIQEIINNIVKK